MSTHDAAAYSFKFFLKLKKPVNVFSLLQLSDLISVRLLNGTSSVLSFRCNNENVQLPLSALSNINQSRETVRLR